MKDEPISYNKRKYFTNHYFAKHLYNNRKVYNFTTSVRKCSIYDSSIKSGDIVELYRPNALLEKMGLRSLMLIDMAINQSLHDSLTTKKELGDRVHGGPLVVYSKTGSPMVCSLRIAEEFCRHHNHILKSIEDVLDAHILSEHDCRLSSYVGKDGAKTKRYELSESGFMKIVPKLNGLKALQIQARFVDAFFEMRDNGVRANDDSPEILSQIALGVAITEKLDAVPKKHKNMSAIDFLRIGKMATEFLENDDVEYLSTRQLAKRHNVGTPTMNKILLSHKLINKCGSGWMVTEKGKQYTNNQVCQNDNWENAGCLLLWTPEVLNNL